MQRKPTRLRLAQLGPQRHRRDQLVAEILAAIADRRRRLQGPHAPTHLLRRLLEIRLLEAVDPVDDVRRQDLVAGIVEMP